MNDGGQKGECARIDRPCADLRVLDLSPGRAGQYCTSLMAGFGADTIAIEPPGQDDRPFGAESARSHDEPLTTSLMRGKRRICLDWKNRVGLSLLLQLAAKSDVLVISPSLEAPSDNTPLFEALIDANPAIILTSITPFGMTGPYSRFTADDLIMNALGGFLHGVGDPRREPLGSRGMQSELLAGACAYYATLAALFQRLADGQGQVVDISVQEVVASTLENALTFAAYSGWEWKRSGSRRSVAYHPVSNFRCADGHVHISILDDRDWRSLCALLDCPEYADNPRFATAKARLENADEVDALLTSQLADWSRDELYHAGQARRLPLAPVNSVADLLASPQLRARSFFRETFDLPGRPGAIGPPFKLSDTPWVASGGVARGENTREICSQLLGLDETLLDELARRRVT